MKKLQRLVNSRTKFLCAKVFETIEKKMPHVLQEREWRNVRKIIFDIANDILKATNDDFNTYDLGYRSYPFCFLYNADGEHQVYLSTKVMDIFNRNVYFMDDPFSFIIKVPTQQYNTDVLRRLKQILLYGSIFYRGPYIYYVVDDPHNCMKIVNLLDMIPFTSSNKQLYQAWKTKLQNWYLHYGDL